MHSCIIFFSKKLPTFEEILNVMTAFSADAVYGTFDEDLNEERELIYPAIMWDWFEIGGRYCGKLKLRVDYEEDNKYRWQFYEPVPREGRLFHCEILKDLRGNKTRPYISEEEYFPYLGTRDGYLAVDGAPLMDIMNLDEIRGWGYVDLDGTPHAREEWDGKKWVQNKKYDEEIEKYIDEHMDCFVTVLDIHD